MQKMIEIKSDGNWPAKSIVDVNQARVELHKKGHFDDNYYLVASSKRIKCLDGLIPDQTITFRQFLLSNNLVKEMVEVRDAINQEDVFLIWYKVSFTEDFEIKIETTAIKITGVICQSPPPPKTLTDAELLERLEEPYPPRNVIREATLRMFRGLQGKAIK